MLYIQDPTYENSKLLLDTILECCSTAIQGGGAYAFVSADGVNLLIGDPIFQRFLSDGRFQLIIGMDEITNTRTLTMLNHQQSMHSNLQANAFLHNTSGSTFHPKFCWFDCGEYGYVITGSGNLTQKGMQRNREAFEQKRINLEELNLVKERWNDWLASVHDFIMPLNDEAVVARAEENAQRMRVMQSRRVRQNVSNQTEYAHGNQAQNDTAATGTREYTDDEIGSWEYDATARVLIAEIPRGENRWNQANFDAHTFQTYFESVPGVAGQMALVLRDIKRDGSLGEIRHRPPVSVASRNYRVELHVERGTTYPTEGRVLGVFVKLSARTFLYTLVFPTNDEYAALQNVLDRHRQRIDRLVRYQTSVQELADISPSLPILQYLSQAD